MAIKKSKIQAARTPNPARCRRIIRTRLAGSLEEILTGFIEQAKEGGSQHMKTTADLLEDKAKAAKRRGKSIEQRMLEEAEAWAPEASQ